MLALLVYSAWPTWEGAHVRDRLADLLDAHRRYVAVLFGALIAGSKPDRARVNARPGRGAAGAIECGGVGAADARRARVASMDRRRRCRRRPRNDTASRARRARAAGADRTGSNPPRPELEPLAKQIDETFRALAHTLRTGTPPRDLPPLRATQEALRTVTSSSIVNETDVIVDSLNTVAQMLGKQELRISRGTKRGASCSPFPRCFVI